MIVPHKQSPKKFLKSLGLKRNREMDCLDKGWISIEFLYHRFCNEKGHKHFNKEFGCSARQLQKYRLKAFVITLLGSLIFPIKEGKISTTLGHVVRMLALEGQNPTKTIVPLILAKMIRALSACVDGKRYFEGCNLLLQLWAAEHFYKREDMIDILDDMGSKIITHPTRMLHFSAKWDRKIGLGI
ncbi:hypothetical protein KY285_020617 [Solanum tuberosum]|nr:hypothetical protein KY285_020617 [Solanum tuberosum]